MAEVVQTQILMREMMTNGEVISATNPLASTFVASETHLGDVGGAYNTPQATISINVTGTYATGDYVGPSGTATEFTSSVRTSGDSGLIASALLIDNGKQNITGELWLFSANVTAPADNAAWALSDADMAKLIGIITFDTYCNASAQSAAQVTGAAIAFEAISSTSIWGCWVTRGAPTYAPGDLIIKLSIMQN